MVTHMLRVKNGLFIQFARTVNVEYAPSVVDKLIVMTGLKELTIVLAEADFNGKHDKYPWVDVLDDEELKALPITAQLSKLRGLRQFALEPRPHCFTDFIRQKAEKAIQEEYKGVRVVDQERSPGSEGPISYGGCERA